MKRRTPRSMKHHDRYGRYMLVKYVEGMLIGGYRFSSKSKARRFAAQHQACGVVYKIERRDRRQWQEVELNPWKRILKGLGGTPYIHSVLIGAGLGLLHQIGKSFADNAGIKAVEEALGNQGPVPGLNPFSGGGK